MLDARQIYRKVTRAIFDFCPEQQKNIAAIVWLYRGQSDRFLRLVESYLAQAVVEGQETGKPLAAFEDALGKLIGLAEPFAAEKRDPDPLAETRQELTFAQATRYRPTSQGLAADVAARAGNWNESGNDGWARQCRPPCGPRRFARHGPTLSGPDQSDRFDGEAELAGRSTPP